jgi:hypothetical protein
VVGSLRLAFPEFGGKDDHISKDGLGDRAIRRWGDGENREMRSSECGIRNLKRGIEETLKFLNWRHLPILFYVFRSLVELGGKGDRQENIKYLITVA